MNLYRITTTKRAYDLSGTGAKLYGGRWNTPGNFVIYSASSVSLAMLETLVHTQHHFLKRSLSLTVLSVPAHLHIARINLNDLPQNWQCFPFDSFTLQRGDRWLHSGISPILEVPSAVNPYESNFLLNPSHSDFPLITIEDVSEIKFDLRLVL